ncbi:MAG: PEP-CTERM sorting domain-containing protein [Verrucomicrobia bacterium]|nr:PEP-CTERM sorting domain-containing protein [Verrucomicrobiota bacterium]
MSFETTATSSSKGWVVSELAGLEFVDATDGTTTIAAITSTLGAQAVPEPHHYAMMAGVGLFFWAFLRRSRLKVS